MHTYIGMYVLPVIIKKLCTNNKSTACPPTVARTNMSQLSLFRCRITASLKLTLVYSFPAKKKTVAVWFRVYLA